MKTAVTIRQAGCLFLALSQEGLQRLMQPNRVINLRAGSGPVSAKPDEFFHVGIGRHDLTGSHNHRQEALVGRPRHGPRYRLQHIDRRVPATLCDGALHNNMAVENPSYRIRNRLIVIVAIHQNRENACNCTLIGARPCPLQQGGAVR